MAELRVAFCAGECLRLLPLAALPHILVLIEIDPQAGEMETRCFCCENCFQALRQKAGRPGELGHHDGLKPVYG